MMMIMVKFKRMRFIWKVIKYIFFATVVSNLFLVVTQTNIGKLNDTEFLFNFFGILLGFELTIFIFIISMVEKIKEKAEIQFGGEKEKINRIENRIQLLYIEIKENIIFSFISLIFIAFLFIINIKIANIGLFGNYFLSQKMAVESFKLALFGLNIYSIYDLISSSFRLADLTGKVMNSKNN